MAAFLAVALTACAGDAIGAKQSEGAQVTLADLKPGLDPQPLEERVKLTAAAAGSEGYAAVALADAMGEFEKENLEVQIEVVTPNSTIFALMAQDRLDFAVTGAFGGMYNQVAGGSNIRFVTGAGELSPESPSGWWQRVAEDGAASCDLKGRNVAIQSGGASNPLAASLDGYLSRCGLSIADVALVELTGAEAAQALQNGAVELAAVYYPFSAPLVKSEDFDLAARSGTGLAGTVMGNLLDERPKVAQAVVRAMLRTVRTYLQGNYYEDPEVVAALSEILGVEKSVITAGYPRDFDPELPPSPKTIQQVEEFWLDVGGILDYNKPVAEKLTDMSLLESILP